MTTVRVLIVDDNPLNIELAGCVLEAAGMVVDSAPHAEQALQQVAENRPDLMLVDIQMPGMDGLALTQRIKSEQAWRHIVVIAFTAYAMKGDEARMLAAGFDGYLAKPIDVRTFADSVRHCWTAQRAAGPG